MADDRFVAIDSNALIHRAFHAFPPNISTSEGVQVNAVYGFTSMLLKVLETLDPKYLVCAFDMRGPTLRHEEYSEYKATRKPMDQSLVDQLPLVREVVEAFNIPILEKQGYEADDVLGTLSEYVKVGKWSSNIMDFVIVSGDNDLLQLVDEKVKVWLPRKSFGDLVMYDVNAVLDKFNFTPEFVVDYKALVGDSSDNIPGVKGIGKVTATDLINKYGHLDQIFSNIERVSSRTKSLLLGDRDNAEMSKSLATIVTDVDLDVPLENCLMKDFDGSKVRALFKKFGFKSLVSRIPDCLDDECDNQFGLFDQSLSSKIDCDDESNENVLGCDDLVKVLLNVEKFKSVIFLFDEEYEVAVVRIDNGELSDYYVKLKDLDCALILKLLRNVRVEVLSLGWESFVRYLLNNVEFSIKDVSDLLEFSSRYLFDVGLAAYILSTGRRDYDFEGLIFSYSERSVSEGFKVERRLSSFVLDLLSEVSSNLKDKLRDQSASIQNPEGLVRDLEQDVLKALDQPLSVVSAVMNCEGIAICESEFEDKRGSLVSDISSLESSIYDLIGQEFNINSPKQLSKVLFEDLGLPVVKKTKSGFSTNEAVLNEIKDTHASIPLILEYREKKKILGTYVEPLLNGVVEGRIHTVFNQSKTSTGRFSSSDPNLQTIPTRSDLGKEIRSMFVSDDGFKFVAADYSQVELRVMAHLSKDEVMLSDFGNGKDFHSATAARLLGKRYEDVLKDDRRVAKTINFGILYGLSPYGLSKSLGISKEEASEYISGYFEEYFGVKAYLESVLEFVKEFGYVETVLGRRRYIPGVNSSNYNVRGAAERESINMPVQGTAAEIMRFAMLGVYKWLVNSDFKARLLLQIHDELVLEVPDSEVEVVSSEVKRIMESVISLDVPLVVDVESGPTLLF